MSDVTASLLAVAAAARQRLLRRRRVRPGLGPAQPDRAARRGRLADGADHAARDGEHLAGDRRHPARHHRLLAAASVPSASPRSRTCSSRVLARARRARVAPAPDRVRDRAADRRLPARRARRDDPQEHRARRARAGRARPRPADVGDRHRAPPRDRRALNAIANGMLRLLRRGARATRSARRTPARRSPPWSRSRAARACSRRTSTTGSPVRSASPRRRSASVLMPPETLDDRAPRLDRGRRRGAVRRHRLQPVPGRRRATASCSATSTSRTCSRPTRRRAHRVVDDKWIRPFAPVARRRPAPRRARDAAAPGRPHGAGRRRRRRRRSGWPRSRT